jgi:hypothetical protein
LFTIIMFINIINKTFKTIASFMLFSFVLSLRVSRFFARAEIQLGAAVSGMIRSAKLQALADSVLAISGVGLLVLPLCYLSILLLVHAGVAALWLCRRTGFSFDKDSVIGRSPISSGHDCPCRLGPS